MGEVGTDELSSTSAPALGCLCSRQRNVRAGLTRHCLGLTYYELSTYSTISRALAISVFSVHENVLLRLSGF